MAKTKVDRMFSYSPDGKQTHVVEPGEHDLDKKAVEVGKALGAISGSPRSRKALKPDATK